MSSSGNKHANDEQIQQQFHQYHQKQIEQSQKISQAALFLENGLQQQQSQIKMTEMQISHEELDNLINEIKSCKQQCRQNSVQIKKINKIIQQVPQIKKKFEQSGKTYFNKINKINMYLLCILIVIFFGEIYIFREFDQVSQQCLFQDWYTEQIKKNLIFGVLVLFLVYNVHFIIRKHNFRIYTFSPVMAIIILAMVYLILLFANQYVQISLPYAHLDTKGQMCSKIIGTQISSKNQSLFFISTTIYTQLREKVKDVIQSSISRCLIVDGYPGTGKSESILQILGEIQKGQFLRKEQIKIIYFDVKQDQEIFLGNNYKNNKKQVFKNSEQIKIYLETIQQMLKTKKIKFLAVLDEIQQKQLYVFKDIYYKFKEFSSIYKQYFKLICIYTKEHYKIKYQKQQFKLTFFQNDEIQKKTFIYNLLNLKMNMNAKKKARKIINLSQQQEQYKSRLVEKLVEKSNSFREINELYLRCSNKKKWQQCLSQQQSSAQKFLQQILMDYKKSDKRNLCRQNFQLVDPKLILELKQNDIFSGLYWNSKIHKEAFQNICKKNNLQKNKSTTKKMDTMKEKLKKYIQKEVKEYMCGCINKTQFEKLEEKKNYQGQLRDQGQLSQKKIIEDVL